MHTTLNDGCVLPTSGYAGEGAAPTALAVASILDTGALSGQSVLLATDGSPGSDAATRIAYELAREHGATVRLVHVVDNRPAPIPPPLDLLLATTDDEAGRAMHAEQVSALRWRVSHVLEEPVDWDARIRFGTPARAIVEEANAIGAALIVMGVQPYSRLDRLVSDATTLATVRAAHCPVLAVASGTERLPSKVLAAMDFSAPSVAAARVAARVMRRGGRMTLAYVQPLSGYRHGDSAEVIHEYGLAAAFERYASEFREVCAVDHIVLHHELRQTIAAALLHHADSIHADLIAVGSVSHGRMERWLLGSVSQDLLREGRHSLLIAPRTA